MNEPDARQLLLAGLPYTGKTSFLALFYLAVDNAPGRLKLGGYKDDREYLNEIAGRLQGCVDMEHTNVDEHRELSLSLEIVSSATAVRLRIPDLSGETWEDAVTKRWWRQEIDEQVRGSEAILVFIHPKRIDRGVTIGDAAPGIEALGVEPAQKPRQESDGTTGKLNISGPSPTQVLVVDMLQLTLEQRGPRPARACVMVSAWDTQPKDLTPQDYLKEELPLVDQYIASNTHWMQSRVFGVSAQGGDFNKARDELVERDAVERAYVRAEDGSDVPIEYPVTWALGLEK